MTEWMLLIYIVPSQPSRKRAYVWRELKRLGAVYLRDGVALLPRREELEMALQIVAGRIREYDGTAHLLLSPRFQSGEERDLVRLFQNERLDEYREVHHAGVRFLRDVLAEVDADDFGFPDVDKLESELGRLDRWQAQVAARDYFHAPDAPRVRNLLEKCHQAFENFTATASMRHAQPREGSEDAFERLGASGVSEEVAAHDFPL